MANIGFKRFLLQMNGLRPKSGTNQMTIRKSGGYLGYRETNYEPNRPYIQRWIHINAGIMWCYIYWCFRHNWRECTVGEYIWPNRDQWSDKYLGIPPDDWD